MRTRVLQTNRNGAENAGARALEKLSVPTLALEQPPPAAGADPGVDPGGELASARIRRAQDILRALLVEDDLAGECGTLSASIAVRLDGIQLELGQLMGLQTLFELWSKAEVIE